MDIREIFPDLLVLKNLTDDYSRLIFSFDHKDSGALIIRLNRLNPLDENKYMYDWWTDANIIFEASKKSFDVDLKDLLDNLELLIAQVRKAMMIMSPPSPPVTSWRST